MKVTASNAELSAVLDILSAIVKNDDYRWPIPVGFRIIQNVEILTRETEAYRKERANIILHFSSSGTVRPEDEGYDECQKQLSELGELETEIEIQPIPADALEGLTLPLRQMVALRFIVAEPEQEGDAS